MDDVVLLAADRTESRMLLGVLRAFLAERLHLELNPRRVVLTPIGEPCDLLGYVLHRPAAAS